MSKKPSASASPKGESGANSAKDAKKTPVSTPSTASAAAPSATNTAPTTNPTTPINSRPVSGSTFQRRGVVNYDNYIDLILAARVKKISFYVPSTQIRSPNLPQKVLLSKEDYVHLLGEIEGTLYAYQGRPEIDVLLINGSINQEHLLFLDLAETYVQQTPALGTPLPRSNPDSRPTSASKKRPGSASAANKLTDGAHATPDGIAAVGGGISISKGATIGEVLGMQENKVVADSKTTSKEKDSSKDVKQQQPSSSGQPSGEKLPPIAQSKKPSTDANGEHIREDTLEVKEGADDDASNVTPFPFTEPVMKTNFDEGFVKLLFDAPRGLLIMTEEIEIALMKLITEHIPAYKQLREQLMDGYDPWKLEEESSSLLPKITTPAAPVASPGVGKGKSPNKPGSGPATPAPSNINKAGSAPITPGPSNSKTAASSGKGLPSSNKTATNTTPGGKSGGKAAQAKVEEPSIDEDDLPPVIKIDRSKINFPKYGIPREDEEIVIVRSYMYIGNNKFNTMEPVREKLWRRFIRNSIYPLFDDVYKLAALRDMIWQEQEAARLKALEELAAIQALNPPPVEIEDDAAKTKKGKKKKGKGKGKIKKQGVKRMPSKSEDEEETEDDTEDEYSEFTGGNASNASKGEEGSIPVRETKS